jgi:hypothetical protein
LVLSTNNFQSLQQIFINTIKFIWIRSVFLKKQNQTSKLKSNNKILNNIKSKILNQHKLNFYTLKSFLKVTKNRKLNFLLKKKKKLLVISAKT